MLFKSKANDGLVSVLAAAARTPAMAESQAGAGRSLWADARRRFWRNKAAVVSLVLLALIALACVVGPWLLPHAFDTADWDAMSLPPSFKNAHFWGTDDAGRDLLVRSLHDGSAPRAAAAADHLLCASAEIARQLSAQQSQPG